MANLINEPVPETIRAPRRGLDLALPLQRRAQLRPGSAADMAVPVPATQDLLPGQTPRAPRMDVDCPVLVQLGDKLQLATLLDISEHGAKLSVDGHQPGETVLVSVPGLPSLAGEIRWSENGRAGIVFNEAIGTREIWGWVAQGQNRLRRATSGTVALLAVACVTSGPATALGSRNNLSVGATVRESCTIATDANEPTKAAVRCTTGTRWQATGAGQQPGSGPGSTGATSSGASGENAVTRAGFVTITY